MESKNKKREIIKNIIIIFLIVMLLLTFFSNTIMNRSLPEVSTQYASYKQISDKIRASATVSANQDYNVVGDETREISEVHVRRGDKVERGQVLFSLTPNESSALSDAQKALNQLLIQKQQMLIEDVSGETADYDYEIKKKQEELDKARADLASIPEYELKLEEFEAEVETLEEALEEINERYDTLSAKMNKYESKYEDIAEKDGQSSAATAKAQAQYDAKKAEIKKLEDEIEALEEKNTELDTVISESNDKKGIYQENIGLIGSTNANISALQSAMEQADAELRAIEREYHYFQEMNSAKNALDLAVGTSDEAAAQEKYNAALAEYTAIAGDTTRTESMYLQIIDTCSTAAKNAANAYYEAAGKKEDSSRYEEKLNDVNRDIANKEKQKNDNALKIEQNKKQIEKINEELEELDEIIAVVEYAKLKSETDTLKKNIKDQTKELENKKEELDEFIEDGPGDADDLEDAIELAEREIEALERKLAADKKNEPYNEEIKRLELENINDSIAMQQKEIARIKSKLTNTEITSPVTGTITSLSYTAGEEFEAGATIATIAISEKGYTMEFSATNEQCRRINIGDRADLQSYYWGEAPEITVTAFKNDQSNPGRGKIVVLSVSGEDITAGQTLNFTLGDNTRSYDKVVPNSAVREDANGKFVLVVESKSTPLGNRYTARRVEVEVLTSDETSSALSGELLGGEFIITTSSAPVSDGMQVRLADK